MERQAEPKQSSDGALVPVGQVKQTSATEFLQNAQSLLARNRQKQAFAVLQQALVNYPNNPYILSYFGYLQALLDKRYRTGVEMCKSAVALARKQAMSGNEVRYGTVYANLGKTYILAGKKKDAIETFQQGLKYESRNTELLRELKALGTRKKPVFSFLSRSNPINKYLGMILNSSNKNSSRR